MKIKGELPYQFKPEQPQNLLVEPLSEREQYDMLWQQDKQEQEQWNRAHFTGFRDGHYFRDGQRPPKK